MAKGPRNYAAEYARRVAKGRAKGQTRQEARGHKPPPGKREAQARKEREEKKVEMLGGLTSAQRVKIKRFLAKLPNAGGLWERTRSMWERSGMRAFEGYRANMLAAAKAGRHTQGTRTEWIDHLNAAYDLEITEAEWEVSAYGALI